MQNQQNTCLFKYISSKNSYNSLKKFSDCFIQKILKLDKTPYLNILIMHFMHSYYKLYNINIKSENINIYVYKHIKTINYILKCLNLSGIYFEYSELICENEPYIVTKYKESKLQKNNTLVLYQNKTSFTELIKEPFTIYKNIRYYIGVFLESNIVIDQFGFINATKFCYLYNGRLDKWSCKKKS